MKNSNQSFKAKLRKNGFRLFHSLPQDFPASQKNPFPDCPASKGWVTLHQWAEDTGGFCGAVCIKGRRATGRYVRTVGKRGYL
jgi:hypothetical protein